MTATATITRPGGDRMYTDFKDAPPARGVLPRVICPEPLRTELVAALNAEQTVFHVWPSDTGRVWASRVTGGPGAVPGKPYLTTGCGEALDADNPAAMRLLLVALGVLEPERGWVNSAAVGDLWRVNANEVTVWARKGLFPDGSARRAPDGTWEFREDVMHELVARAITEAVAA